jgi:hypothetical protein
MQQQEIYIVYIKSLSWQVVVSVRALIITEKNLRMNNNIENFLVTINSTGKKLTVDTGRDLLISVETLTSTSRDSHQYQ